MLAKAAAPYNKSDSACYSKLRKRELVKRVDTTPHRRIRFLLISTRCLGLFGENLWGQ